MPELKTAEQIRRASAACRDYVVGLRRHFHENPEVGGHEDNTRQYIEAQLRQLGIESYTRVGPHGLLVSLPGHAPGRTVFLRADMDALPVQESETNLNAVRICMSKQPGTAHMCGHDAHMAVMLGVIRVLKALDFPYAGTVLVGFEEGEEVGAGVRNMLQALEPYPVDACWFLHVWSSLKSGTVNVEPGPRMAGSFAFDVHVVGKGGHASRPDLCASPIFCAANILTNLTSVWVNEMSCMESTTLGIGMLEGGTQLNIIPDRCRFAGTIRYLNREEGLKGFEALKRISEHVAAAHRCAIEYGRMGELAGVNNDPFCAGIAREAVASLCGAQALAPCPPVMGSETAAMYLRKYPGVYALLGIENAEKGCGAEHHNCHFDLDEDVLENGVAISVGFALRFLESKEERGTV